MSSGVGRLTKYVVETLIKNLICTINEMKKIQQNYESMWLKAQKHNYSSTYYMLLVAALY